MNQQIVKIFVSVAIRDGANVLLVQEGKQDSLGLWNLPGGHLEFGETLQAGAAREVKEETGLEVSLYGLIGAYTSIRVENENVEHPLSLLNELGSKGKTK